MRIDPAGWPFVIGFLGAALVLAVAGGGLFVCVPVALSIAILLFFRDPDRRSPSERDIVLAPADGRVMVAGPSVATAMSADEFQQISIFLSPLDVHVNRMPVAGRVTRVKYHPGRFLPAYRSAAGDLNEHTEVWLDVVGATVVVRQVVGLLARRIVCRTREGATVEAGERFGVMKFGSRMDVFLPRSATLEVEPGDRVVGGITVVARMAPAETVAESGEGQE